jgi:pimeloyl-ACP methyl ester carboxylesterase
LRDRREAWVLPNPGFGEGEPMPQDIASILDVHVDAVQRCAGDGPFALVGYSSGGFLAHAVASRLERLGISPRAVVLIDTYLPKNAPAWLRSAFNRIWWEWYPEIPRVDDELTAMATYLKLFETWTPAPINTPILCLRAVEAMHLGADDSGVATTTTPELMGVIWDQPHCAIEVPGTHVSMMGEHADTTAKALDEWLSNRLPPESKRAPFDPLEVSI